MISLSVDDVKAITGIAYSQDVINGWADFLQVQASSCLADLTEPHKTNALLFAVAHFLSLQGTNGRGALTSESFGDASRSYAQLTTGNGLTQFARMAMRVAPCMSGLFSNRSGAVRLVR